MFVYGECLLYSSNLSSGVMLPTANVVSGTDPLLLNNKKKNSSQQYQKTNDLFYPIAWEERDEAERSGGCRRQGLRQRRRKRNSLPFKSHNTHIILSSPFTGKNRGRKIKKKTVKHGKGFKLHRIRRDRCSWFRYSVLMLIYTVVKQYR